MGRTIAAIFATLLILAPAADAEIDARGVLDAWLAAQNGGRYADYEALYAPAFRGVRRSGGKTIELDRAGWLKDRQRMFKRPMKVTVDKLNVEPQADGVHLTFMQTFESGSYADVGKKELIVASGLIVREELRSSERLQPAAAGDAACDVLDCKKATPESQRAIVAACVKGCDAGGKSACRERANLFGGGYCGVVKDEAQAAAFYEKACKLKEEMSCVFAAQLIEAKEPARAATLYEEGCRLEDPDGCIALAFMLRDGKAVAKDVKRAVELMDKLCREDGRSAPGTNSCGELEKMYRDGTGGVRKDRALAREYHQLLKEATSGE